MELIELEAEESLPLLARGGVDIAIAEEYEHAPRPHQPELHRDDLEPDELVLTLPRGHARPRRRRRCALGSLRDAAVGDRAGRHRTTPTCSCARAARAGFEPDVHHRVNDIRMLLDLVAVAGVAALLPSLGRPEDDPRVAVRPLAGGPFSRALFVATRAADRARPSTAAVVDAIRGRRQARQLAA